jgi:hypothetical protein
MSAKIGMSGSAAIAQTFPPQSVEQALIAAAEAALPLHVVVEPTAAGRRGVRAICIRADM